MGCIFTVADQHVKINIVSFLTLTHSSLQPTRFASKHVNCDSEIYTGLLMSGSMQDPWRSISFQNKKISPVSCTDPACVTLALPG